MDDNKRFITQNVWKDSQANVNSYVLKHIIQKYTKEYMTDEETQALLKECGFIPHEKYKSWFYARINPEIELKYYGAKNKRLKLQMR